MVMAFGSSCCSAALTALEPTAVTDKAIAVAIRVTGFMGLLLGSPLGARRQRASSARMVAQRPRRGKTAGLRRLVSTFLERSMKSRHHTVALLPLPACGERV